MPISDVGHQRLPFAISHALKRAITHTVGFSTYFRIIPAVCIAPLPTLITQAVIVFAVIVFVIVPFSLFAQSLSFINSALSLLSGLGILWVLRLTKDEYSPQLEGLLGWSYVALVLLGALVPGLVDQFMQACCPDFCLEFKESGLGTLIAQVTDRYTIYGCAMSIFDLVCCIILLCVCAYIAGVFYASAREPRLVDLKNRIIVLWVLSGGECVVADIEHYYYDEGNKHPVAFISNARRYTTLNQIEGDLHWIRFAKLVLDRSNARL